MSATSLGTAVGRHRGLHTVLPLPPEDEEKYWYAWRSLPYHSAALFVSAGCVITAQAWFEIRNVTTVPLLVTPFAFYTLTYLVYQSVSLPVNYTGSAFDLAGHQARVRAWRPGRYPSVDIFLPICGEPIELLRNTWTGVCELAAEYPGEARAYVLDDGDSDEARSMAAVFGFDYIRRPVHEFKKSGNLNYAFPRTRGEHIVIFDADFRPRPDFLAETLPYMDDPAVGIVQTPQFFRVSPQQTWVERAAGATLEIFYRTVQVSRDRFGSALCVGSNAVYRRAALEPEGGFTLIPYAEDSHTGLDARRHGYALTYMPISLATGICPASLDTYMRQQYRWCYGATSLVWTRHMWSVPMGWKSRIPFIAGWLWNFTTALRTIVLPLLPVVLLLFLPDEIRLRNALLLVPVLVTGTILYPLWHYAPYSPRIWPLSLACGWAQALAIWDYSRGKVMSWRPSRGPKDATRRFWWCVTLWNGTLALAWLSLALWRIYQTGSSRFAIVLLLGLANMAIVGRLVFPGRGTR